MDAPRLALRYASAADFLAAWETEFAAGGLLVRQTGMPAGARECVLDVEVEGRLVARVAAQIAAVRASAVAVVFDEPPPELARLAVTLQGGTAAAALPETPAASGAQPPAPDDSAGALADRLAAMSPGQKIQAALSGDRETRIALLRDMNRAVHIHVLRNPKVTLEEVGFAARQGALSADALKYIAEHRDWSRDPSICLALVRNQATPVAIALRVLPRVPPNELKAIARGSGKPPVVQAARKLVIGTA